jgi:hypothetical protein
LSIEEETNAYRIFGCESLLEEGKVERNVKMNEF